MTLRSPSRKRSLMSRDACATNDSNWSPAVYKKCCYVCESFLCSFEHLLASDSAMAFPTTHEGTLEKAFQPLIQNERPARERSRDPTDIEAQIEEIQARRRAGLAEGEGEGESGGDKVGLNSLGHFDMNVYSSGDKSGYVTSIPANEEEDVSRSKFIGRPVEKFTFVREIFAVCSNWKNLVLQEAEEDLGVAPPPGRATYHAPSDVMADLPPNDQVLVHVKEPL